MIDCDSMCTILLGWYCGTGKSSLLAALFRLAEPEGVLEIDGIQTTDIGLLHLHKKI